MHYIFVLYLSRFNYIFTMKTKRYSVVIRGFDKEVIYKYAHLSEASDGFVYLMREILEHHIRAYYLALCVGDGMYIMRHYENLTVQNKVKQLKEIEK